MLNNKLNRRTFLKASAATTALATIGTVEFKAFQERAQAFGEAASNVPSVCDGCSNKCGINVYKLGEHIWKIQGLADHPSSKGKVCARGHGLVTFPYLENRVTQPLKKVSNGEFEPISWEQAYKEIGSKLNEIIKKNGPNVVAYNENPRPTGTFYGKRFLDAIGSPNYFTHHSACSNGRDTGFKHTLGGVPSADVENSKYILFIGRSYGDGIKPSSVQELATAKDRRAKVVIVDPRLNNTAPFADEWVAIRPGTDLALVLAMSNVLVTGNLYDKDFVEKYSIGFEEYANALEEYTPEWASKITGISAEKITEIARDMAALKPNAVIEPSWRGAFGATYSNGAEAARAVALFNALLGNIQQSGGPVFKAKPELGTIGGPTPQPSTLERVDAEFKLVPTNHGVSAVLPEKAKQGKIKAAIFNHTNPVRNYSNPEYMTEGLNALELMVVIDVQLSETALLADYVLPEASYLERDHVISSDVGSYVFAQKAIEKIHPETKGSDEIFTELAKEMGLGKYFDFALEELNEAILAPANLSMKQMRDSGTITLALSNKIGTVPTLKTPSGKVEFSSDAYKKAGFSPVVKWIEPSVKPSGESVRLITGKQGYHSQTFTADIPELMAITEVTNGERLWINTRKAELFGVKDGDLVEVYNDVSTKQVRVKVTERLHPEAVYVPSGYGRFSEHLKTAYGVGFSYLDLLPYQVDPIGGTIMAHENIVKVRKVRS
ncbi:molybdopterin-dependent oxidoreductase [Bacillaceae bacterium S4-13-58]